MRGFSIRTLLLGVFVGAGLVLYLDFGYERGLVDGRLETQERFEARPEEEKDGVWYYSNLDTEFSLLEKPIKKKYSGPILFSSHLSYSKEFAERYGYPDSYVTDELPSFVDYIEFEMKYAAGFNRCNIKMLVEKSAPVRLPKFPIFRAYAGTSLNMMPAAQPRQNRDFSERDYQQKFRMQSHEYFSDAALKASVHESFALVGAGLVTMRIDVAKQNLFAEWDFLSLRVGCSDLIKSLTRRGYMTILMRPKDSEADSIPMSLKDASKFIQVAVPQKIAKLVKADFDKIDFTKNMRKH